MNNAQVPGREREAELVRMMETYGGMLTGLCTGMLNDRHLAQDMVQEAFLKAWRHMDSLRGGPGSEKAWLCRIALNLCRDYQRTRWFRLVDRDDEKLAQLPAPAQEEPADLLCAIQQLPPRFREVILLHYYQDMEAEEMDRALGLSPSAVYRRLRKARGKLKQLLDGRDDDE